MFAFCERGVQKHKFIPLLVLIEFLMTSEEHLGASSLSFSVINTQRNPSLLLLSRLLRTGVAIFRLADSVSHQTTQDLLGV